MRQIVLDTETTGLDVADGHRVIEIGAVEIINRLVTDHYYHQYLNPEREIDAGAEEVHGISTEFLADKPKFIDVHEDFLEFVGDSELIIHNAPFDIGFLNHELNCIEHKVKDLRDICSVIDTLSDARKLHPGQRNSLDALCKRYEIDNSHRELHGALLDAQILADVYLAMTGGQVSLSLHAEAGSQQEVARIKSSKKLHDLRVISASQEEIAEHEKLLMHIAQNNDKQIALWSLEPETEH
ncbi:MAG: DNA polymerase III subunit epsilon [Pseudomonadota bacterium]